MKTIYLESAKTTEDEPPIEVMVESNDLVEHIIKMAVDYWNLCDKENYRLMKDELVLENKSKVNDVPIKDEETLRLVKR